MLSPVDKVQTEKYKQMLGLTNIFSTTFMSILQARATMGGELYISGITTMIRNTTIMGSITTNNNLSIVGNITVAGNLYSNNILSADIQVDNNIVCNNCDINSTLACKNIKFGNLASNNINISGLCFINNNLNSRYINQLYDSLYIYSPIINIGNVNSEINIVGTTTYIAINEIKLYDKLISINSKYIGNTTKLSPTYKSHGEDSGINIWAYNNLGFIKTNTNGSGFIIKAPQDNNIRTIALVDYNNNLTISGVTNLYGRVTVLTSLNVDGTTLLCGNTEFIKSLIGSGNSIFGNDVRLHSNIFISGDTIINNNATILSKFDVNGEGYFNGDTTINSSLSINGNTNIQGSITILSSLNILGNTLLGGTAVLRSKLSVGNTSVINGTTTINSSLFISKATNIYGTLTLMNNLTVSTSTNLQGTSTINSNLTINGPILIDGNMTIGSILAYSNNDFTNYSNLYILSKLISQLPDYATNTDAINGGVPLWGFYRTGGILKVRLEDIPVILQLIDSDAIINYSSYYYESGVIVLSTNNNINPYLISITNIQSTINLEINIQVQPNTFVTSTSILPIGDYTITYSATDIYGNTGYISRNLKVINNTITDRFVNNIIQSWIVTGQPYTITSNGLQSGYGVSWALSTSFLTNQAINYNSSWSIVLKFKINNWYNGFQINIDPTFDFWSSGSLTTDTTNCGITNITFNNSYFTTSDSYWTLPINTETNNNFLSAVTNDIYLVISRDNTTQRITISFYDYNTTLIDSQTSEPIIYTRFKSLFSFTINSDITWYYGFSMHKIDTNINIAEFQFI